MADTATTEIDRFTWRDTAKQFRRLLKELDELDAAPGLTDAERKVLYESYLVIDEIARRATAEADRGR
jgi:hypothetical protein